MDFTQFYERYWNSFDVKILLANIAIQKKLGVLNNDKYQSFLSHIDGTTDIFNSSEDLLSSNEANDYRLEEMFFSSNCYPELEDDCILMRVAPLLNIFDSVEVNLHYKAEFDKAAACNATNIDIDIALSNLFGLFSSSKFDEFNGEWPEELRKYSGILSETSFLEDKGIGLSSLENVPKFVTYLINGLDSANNKLEKISTELDHKDRFHIADHLRDIIGLDNYSKEYNKKPTILGFFLFKAGDLEESAIRRPSPFDKTSSYRFRGACSKDSKDSPCTWGHTTDLNSLYQSNEKEETNTIIGVSEIVLKNTLLKPDAKILIGYGGFLKVSREDSNLKNGVPETLKMQNLHQYFLENYLEGHAPECIWEKLFE